MTDRNKTKIIAENIFLGIRTLIIDKIREVNNDGESASKTGLTRESVFYAKVGQRLTFKSEIRAILQYIVGLDIPLRDIAKLFPGENFLEETDMLENLIIKEEKLDERTLEKLDIAKKLIKEAYEIYKSKKHTTSYLKS